MGKDEQFWEARRLCRLQNELRGLYDDANFLTDPKHRDQIRSAIAKVGGMIAVMVENLKKEDLRHDKR